MTELGNIVRNCRWISWGALWALLAVGGFRVAPPATAAVTAADPRVILESPTGQKPPPKKDEPDEKKPPPKTKTDESLYLPSQNQLFRLESEKALRERVKRELKGKFAEFPASTIVLSKTPYVKRFWDPLAETVEPYYTVYRRLYFEQINAERYGWDFGYMHPLIATGTFYWDFATLPFQFIAEPCRRYEYNSGYCLPGDPVPLLLYPPHPK